MQARLDAFLKWAHDNGVTHPKILYPAFFGEGDAAYPGCLALEDIQEDEIIIRVPGHLVLTAKVAYYSELHPVFYEHPELFGRHASEGEDLMIAVYVLYELQKGAKSFWKPLFDVWPRGADVLWNWEDEELEELQDETLVADCESYYKDCMNHWNRMYKVISQYPEHFKEEFIGFNSFKWIWILLTNRCFSSAWNLTAIVPFAEFLNHENVNVSYDCLIDGKTRGKEDVQKALAEEEKERLVLR